LRETESGDFMADDSDLFSEVFGKNKAEKAAPARAPDGALKAHSKASSGSNEKSHSKSRSISKETDSTSDALAEPKPKALATEREVKKSKRKKRSSKPKPAAEESSLASPEHRSAIKKMLLSKAHQAANEETEAVRAKQRKEEIGTDDSDDDEEDEDSEDEEIDEDEDSGDESGNRKTKKGRADDSDDDDSDDDEEGEDEDLDGGEETAVPKFRKSVAAENAGDDSFLDSLNEDEWLHEGGIEEEGIHTPLKSEKPAAPVSAKPTVSIPVSLTGKSEVPLKFLEDAPKNMVFIGRKKSVFKQFGDQAALFIGKVDEPGDENHDRNVHLDSLNPHVVFLCGARGSGKSYGIGVIAEELALKNKDVGAIVVDPIGVFWSMRLPNKEEKEVASLGQWQLLPQGIGNIKVFIPRGTANDVPKSTYDATFAIQPSLLSVEDWCLTFSIERFSPAGLLLEKALAKLREGYENIDNKKIKGKGSAYSLDDLIECLEKDSELNSRERGYKQDSIRALVSRFEAAKNWGIFDHKGTPLGELSRPGQLTILDTSFLEDNVTALVIGVLARRILSARKISARKEAAKRLKTTSMDELLELDIPPTWLFIDEAHTLIPSGNVSTPATKSLVEYVKQGRRPGCSLVFATQQPSAIDTRVLSQLDVLIAHKLVFDDDIKAVYKRAPTVIPLRYKVSSFIKTLPVGVGLTADRREETSRAFVLKIRPRMSQHEGRDAETATQTEELTQEQVESLASELLLGKLSKEGEIELAQLNIVVDLLNAKYKASAKVPKILELLKKKKVIVEGDTVLLPGVKKKELDSDDEAPDSEGGSEMVSLAEMRGKGKKPKVGVESPGGEIEGLETAEESEQSDFDSIELISLPVRVTAAKAGQIAQGQRKGGFLGIVGERELVKSVMLKHEPLYRVKLEVPQRQSEFVAKECFISALSGEFVHFSQNRFFEESKGVSKLWKASNEEVRVLQLLLNKKISVQEIAKATGFSEDEARGLVKSLVSDQLLEAENKGGRAVYFVSRKTDLPPSVMHPKMESLSHAPFEKMDTLSKVSEKFSQKEVPALISKLFPTARVKRIEVVYRPFYEAELERGKATRKIRIDGFNGIVSGKKE